MITFLPRPFYVQLEKPPYPLISRLCGLRSRFGRFQEAGNIFPVSEIEYRFLGFPFGGAVPIPAVLFNSLAQSPYRPCRSIRWRSPHTGRAVPFVGAVPIPTVLFHSLAQSPYRPCCSIRWRSPHTGRAVQAQP